MLPVAADAAEALFRVVDAAYEKRSAATIGSPRPRPSSSAKRDIEPRELRDRPAPLPAGATVAVVARALASSPRQIQRAFAELGGTSFSAYLREVRLRNAAMLLARQPLTVW
jgi:AraC-like DNA-binding protein